jgi:hypothetical protein
MEVLGPLLLVPYFAGVVVYKALFSWWFDPWSQRKANQALWLDLQSQLYFLTSKGQVVRERQTRVQPFDYATVRIAFENVCFCFTRGRRELNISLSPSYQTGDRYDLLAVIAALDSKDTTELPPIDSLWEAADVIGSRLDDLNRAFSEREYPDFKHKLVAIKNEERIQTRQMEWELNKRLYGSRSKF